MKRRILAGLLAGVVFLSSGVFPSASQKEVKAAETSGWDWLKDTLSACGGTWYMPDYAGAVSETMPETALLGNGDVGVVSYGNESEKTYLISKGDFWNGGDLVTSAPYSADDRSIRQIALGGVTIRQNRENRSLTRGEGVTVTASSVHDYFQPERAVNGVISADEEGWVSAAGNGSHWLQIDLGSEQTIARYVMHHIGTARPDLQHYNAKEYTVSASTDGETWKEIDHVRENTASVTSCTLTQPVQARYVRIDFIQGQQDSNDRGRIAEFELFSSASDRSIFEPQEQGNRSLTRLDGVTVQASSHHDNFVPENVVNGQIDASEEGWVSPLGVNEQWLKIDLGTERTFEKYAAYHIGSARPELAHFNTKAFTVSASNDDKSYSVIDTVTGNVGNATERVLKEPVTARYIKLEFQEGEQQNAAADQRARIAEFEVFASAEDDSIFSAKNFEEKQDIVNGDLTTKMAIGGVPIVLDTWLSATENIMVTKISSQSNSPLELDASAWTKSNGSSNFPNEAGITEDRSAVWTARSTYNAAKSRTDSWTSKAVISARLAGEKEYRVKQNGDAGASLLFTLEPKETVYLVTSVGGGGQTYNYQDKLQTEEPTEEAGSLGAEYAKENALEELRTAHEHWWKDYWMKSYINIGDEEFHRYYYGSLYYMGAAARKDTLAPGLYGIWATTDQSKWNGDYHLNYNYIAPFYGMYSSNRTDGAYAATQPILDYMPKAEAAAKKNLRDINAGYVDSRTDLADGIDGGVLYPVGLAPWGQISWEAETSEKYLSQTLDAPFAATSFISYYNYTKDETFLIERAWPFVEKVAAFYSQWCEKEVTGNGTYQYNLYDASHEGWDFFQKNAGPTIGAVLNVYEFLIDNFDLLKKKAGATKEQFAVWKDMYEHMAPVPIRDYYGKEIFALAEEGLDLRAESASVELEFVHPGERLSFDSEPRMLEIARNTVEAKEAANYDVWSNINNTPKIFTQAIRVGYDPAYIMEKFRDSNIRSMKENFIIQDYNHGIEKAGGIEFINNMLLQSSDGILKVFPNWTGADASFHNLREKGAYLVSSEMSSGAVQWVEVVSEKGDDVTIVTPWKQVKVTDEAGNKIETTTGRTKNTREDTVTFAAEAGKVYRMAEDENAGFADEWEEVSSILDSYPGIYTKDTRLGSPWDTNHSPDGPLMGNGTVYAFLAGNQKDQNIYISHSNMWQDRSGGNGQEYTTFGVISVKRANGNGTRKQSFLYEQDMKQAEITAKSEDGFTMDTWLSAKENLLVAEIENATGEAMEMEITTQAVNANATAEVSGETMIATKQGISEASDRLSGTGTWEGWRVNLAMASRLIGQDIEKTVKTENGKNVLLFSLKPGQKAFFVSAVEGGKEKSQTNTMAQAKKTALDKLESRNTKESLELARQAHREYWKSYWLKSYINIQDKDIERMYYGMLYQLGCSTSISSERNGGIAAGLFPWTACDHPEWQGDYTTNTDFQRQIHPLVTVNRTEGIQNYINIVKQYWPEAKRRSQSAEHLNWIIEGTGRTELFTEGIADGALFPTHIGPWGASTEQHNNANDYFNSPTDATSVLMPIVKLWKYTKDETLLEELYPMMRDVTVFWENYVILENGKYVVYGATHEGIAGRNPILDVDACSYMLKNTILAAKELGKDAEKVKRWQEILNHMSSVPTMQYNGKTTICDVEGRTQDDTGATFWENPVTIQSIYYFDSIGMSAKEEEKEKYYNYLEVKNGRGNHRRLISATRLGYDIQEIMAQLKEGSIDPEPAEWSGLRGNNTIGDIGATGMMAIVTDSLIQSNEGFIHIFANWHQNQQTRFRRLRAENAFLVDADQNAAGQVTYANIYSEKGETCTVLNPWSDQGMRVYENGTEIPTQKERNSLGTLYTFSTQAGNNYELRTNGKQEDYLSLDQSEITLQKGEIWKPEADTSLENPQISFTSSDTEIAVTGRDGSVLGLQAGTAVIRAKEEKTGLTAACTVKVEDGSERNVAAQGIASASSTHENLDAQRAISGNWYPSYEGWASANESWDQNNSRWLAVDLGESYTISRWVLRHGGHRTQNTEDAQGDPEDASNWGNYYLQVSPDGESGWKTVDSKIGNKNNTTDQTLQEPVTGRYFHIYMEFPMFLSNAGWQWESGFARLNQVELYEKREAVHILAEETELPELLEAAKGTPFEELKLPKQIGVRLNRGIWILTDVDWDSELYHPNQAGEQKITGMLQLPLAIENTKELKAEITVKIKEKSDPDPTPENPNADNTKKAMAAGTVFNSGNFQYKVKESSVTNGTVEVQKLLKNKKKITIPASVKKDGITYRVVSIRKKAFFKNKKAESVVIGENITNIGAKSFYGCRKLKSIKFMGAKAPKIGKGAFSKIKSGYKINIAKKMTAKQRKAFQKALKKNRLQIRDIW